MSAPTSPSEEEIRGLVAAVLEGVATSEQASSTVSSPVGDEQSGPVAAAELAIGADHGGYRLKERIVADLRERG